MELPARTTNSFWWALDAAERVRIGQLLGAFEQIDSAKDGIKKVCITIAGECRYLGRGFSWKTIYNAYTLWRNQGRDWRVLVRDWNGRESRLPVEFKVFAVQWLTDGTRGDSFKARHIALRWAWVRNKFIPGYGVPADWWAKNRANRPFPTGNRIDRVEDFPLGWTAENLRALLPQKALVMLKKRGFHAAHGLLPQAHFDRSNLRPLERVTFDDVRLDLQVVAEWDGVVQPCFVNAIFALDIGTAKILSYCLKPRLKREDDTHMGLARDETKNVILGLLSRPLPLDYKMTLLMENASATLGSDEERFLEAVLTERVNIEHTGLTHRALLKEAGFIEQGGQAWMKGQIESIFRPLQLLLDALPGSTGNYYTNSPGDLDNRLRYTVQVLRAAKKQGVDWRGLWMPLLTMEQLERVMDEVVDMLNCRTEHKLQGFQNVTEFYNPTLGMRLAMDEFQKLTIPQREGWVQKLHPESPTERWNRLTRGLHFEKLPAAALFPLYDRKREVQIRNGRIELTDKSYSNDKLVYPLPHEIALSGELEGRKLLAAIPDDREFLHLYTPPPKLAYVLSAARIKAVDMGDRNAVLAEAGRVGRLREDYYSAAASMCRDGADILAGKAHNETRLSGFAASTDAYESDTVGVGPRAMSTRRNAVDKRKTEMHESAQAARYARGAEFAKRAAESDDTF